MINNFLSTFFNLDAFAIIMIRLVAYIGICVTSFALRYMKGDKQYGCFFINLIMLIFSVIMMVSSDHLALLLIASCLSNIFLVRLMTHKSSWKAANASGMIAANHYILSTALTAKAFTILYLSTGKTSINAIINQETQPIFMQYALVLILIAGMIQSAIWPFHRWLLSSLNSPTPVSAIMHAGLINSGGFLLVRFAPLYLQNPNILIAIFCIGLTTALLGTLWKLMQSDIKRMLACSTMSQMGFMLVQCGLGLFPSAVAHLVWHSTFKAYLFLASGSSAQEKKLALPPRPKTLTFICSLICGIAGSLCFGYASGKAWKTGDTTLVLMVVAFIASSQLALAILDSKPLQKTPLAILITMAAGLFYGSSVYLITSTMKAMDIMQPQALNSFHVVGIIILTLAWLSMLFIHDKISKVPWILKWYVKALNASQPSPATITAHRNHYQYR